MVGRDHELAEVTSWLDAVPNGPEALILEGEAGIGKTTVWRAVTSLATERGFTLLASMPAESEATLAFAALADLMHGTLDRIATELPAPQRHALEVALLIQDPGDDPPEQRAVFAACLSVICNLAASGPVLIAVDDLQWLDTPSTSALRFVLRRLKHEPVGVLASVRTDAGGALTRGLTSDLPDDRMTWMTIGPLDSAVFEAALRRHGLRLTRRTMRRIYEASAGNVFYGLELGRWLERVGEPGAGEPLSVPSELADVLRGRLSALPIDVQDVLLLVSCLASPSTDLLARASSGDVSDVLAAASAEGIIQPEGGRLRFTHPLFASTIYARASESRRRGAHRALADILPNGEERARHLALASAGPDDEVAAALDHAAEAAAERGAPTAAADLADLASVLTPADDVTAGWRRRRRAAGYRFLAGDTATSRADLEALVEEMPVGSERAEALLQLGKVLTHYSGDRAAEPILEQALTEASGSAVLEARIHIEIARTSDSKLSRRSRHAEAALASVEEIAEPTLLAEALIGKMLSDLFLGRPVDIGLGERAMQLEGLGKPPRPLDGAALALGICHTVADRFDEARVLYGRALLAARDGGDESSLPEVLGRLADLEVWTGQWSDAERYAAESVAATELTEQGAWISIARYVRGLVDAHLGRVADARAAGEEGLIAATSVRDEWSTMMLEGMLGFLELSANEIEAAEAHLSTAAELADRIGLQEPAMWRFHANHVEAVIGIGDLERAESLLERLESWGRNTDRAWTLATSARCRGLMWAARGELEGALEALELALDHHDGLRMPFERGRTLLVIGQVHRRAKHKRAAKDYLQQALDIHESLPAPLWAERARSELSRIGLRPPAPTDLTPTEERVVALVASGRTNRQVAEALFISPRTVEANLARAYRKLGVSSRAELGAAIARKGSVSPPS